MTHQVLLLLALSMHVYDTTIYCIGDTADNTVASLNKALSDGTEQMVSRNLFYPSLSKVGSYTIDEKTTHRANCLWQLEKIESSGWNALVFWALLSMTCFPGHIKNLQMKKRIVNKLILLKRSSFLRRNALLDLYFKIILPSVSPGLVVWGGCLNVDLLNSLQILHNRACMRRQPE